MSTAPRARDAVRWTTRHDEQLVLVINAIFDEEPYVEGSCNKEWWRQDAAGMCSVMQHEVTIRRVKQHAKVIDVRGVRRHKIGLNTRCARNAEAWECNDVTAAKHAYDEAVAMENAVGQRMAGRMDALAQSTENVRTARQQLQMCVAGYSERVGQVTSSVANDKADMMAAKTRQEAPTAMRERAQETLRLAQTHPRGLALVGMREIKPQAHSILPVLRNYRDQT